MNKRECCTLKYLDANTLIAKVKVLLFVKLQKKVLNCNKKYKYVVPT